MRNTASWRWRTVGWVMLLSLGTLSGCGSDEANSPTGLKLQAIGKLYMDYAISRTNVGPANEQDFKKHIRGLPDHVINGNGMDPKAIDEAFVSARDNEPFVIIYGTKIAGWSAKDEVLVAHEKTGKNGTFLVGFTNGRSKQVDDAGLQELKTKKS